MGFDVLRTPQQAAQEIQLNIGSESRFEALRATIWGNAAAASKIHVNRVLNSALPTWRVLSQRASLSEEALRAELRDALSTLQETGDLLEFSGGYWAPATARFVELPDGAGYLLIGGVPSAFLPIDPETIQYHGPHRYFSKIPTELATALPIEDLKAWSGLPNSSLEHWHRELIESIDRQPYAPTVADVFEFYLPENVKPGAPQFTRWFESAGSTSSTLLARRARIYGAREYRLVDVRSGRIISACELHDIDVRRLMYAIDLAAKNPVRARPVDHQTWLFMSELPRAEQRTFAAFGTLTIPEDRPFERRWTFLRNEEIALDMLRSLGIELGQQYRENR
ncbi:hypothetical protein MNQ95_07475 [Pseudoxanthomonas daejeonensis]|uniref:hypothetical protein n=1 Tax=Pseudoxanthomonas daejeonensis TaxID=266062 RepID=UPI001F54385B|nr:hypothetical protein [Pseudoxanthomonas daejeonensis]UNK58903.1 hypothetical protein MNQ95_07475 [Pseudoxanthomonas daejeonensis]